MREIKKVVIHCTDSPDSLDIGCKEIRQWHTDPPRFVDGVNKGGRGWSDIGYHYVIRRTGSIERGRDDSVPGAHVKGHNSDSIGIVWVGRDDIDSRQQQSLLNIVRVMMNLYDLSIDDVYGHNELYPGKTCPNLDMDRFRAELVFTNV